MLRGCGVGLLGLAGRRGVRTRFTSEGNLAAATQPELTPRRLLTRGGHGRDIRTELVQQPLDITDRSSREQCGTFCPDRSVPGLRMRLITEFPHSSVCSGKWTTVPAPSWWPRANTQAVIATVGQVGGDALRSSGKAGARLPGRCWSPGPGQGRAPASFSGCGTRDLPPAPPTSEVCDVCVHKALLF